MQMISIQITNWFIDKTKKSNTQNRNYQKFLKWVTDLSSKKSVYFHFKKKAGLHQEGYADYEISVQQWYDQVYLPEKESQQYLQEEFDSKGDFKNGSEELLLYSDVGNINWWDDDMFEKIMNHAPAVDYILKKIDPYILEQILNMRGKKEENKTMSLKEVIFRGYGTPGPNPNTKRPDGVDPQMSVSDSYDYIKPQHYTLWNDNNDVNEVIMNALTPEEYEGFCKGNILKYQLRLGKKPNESIERDKGKIEEYQKFLKIAIERQKL